MCYYWELYILSYLLLVVMSNCYYCEQTLDENNKREHKIPNPLKLRNHGEYVKVYFCEDVCL
jgi:hypothetical protein